MPFNTLNSLKNRWLERISIRQKVWFGFGFLLLIMQALAIMVLIGQQASQTEVSYIIDRLQPTAFRSQALVTQLEHVSSTLGRYMLTLEPNYKNDYYQSVKKLNNLLEQMAHDQAILDNPQSKEMVADVMKDIEQYRLFQERLLYLTEHETENIPGQGFAQQNMSPIGEQLRDLAGRLITDAQEELAVELATGVSAMRHQQLVNKLQLYNDLRYLWANVMIQIRGYMTYRDAATRDNILLYMQQLNEVLARSDKFATKLNLVQEDALQQYKAAFKSFEPPLAEFIKIHDSDQWRTDAHLLRTEVVPLLEHIETDMILMAREYTRLSEQTGQKLLADITQRRTAIMVLDGVAIILGILVATAILYTIKCRLQRVMLAMDNVSQGDGTLTHHLDERGHDEVAQLSRGFNRFVAKIKNVVDLVISSSTSLAKESNAMSVITRKTQEGAVQQQTAIDEVATAFREMSSVMDQVVDSSTAAVQAAQQAGERAHIGQDVVGKTVNAITELADEVEQATDVIATLEQEGSSIESVLSVIRDIAEQTNLLALNAAIEAARAGEQGRGFAVVADEVRNLASRTHNETQQIQQRIARLQSVTRDAVDVMHRGRDKATQGMEQAAEADAALKAIDEAVKQISSMNDRIRAAAQSQRAISTEVNSKITHIHEIAQLTANDAVQTSRTSHELSLMAGQLEGLVTQFLLQDEKEPKAASAGAGDEDVTLF